MEFLTFSAIALAIGAPLYRVLPVMIRKHVDLDSSLGELLAFGIGATFLVAFIAAAWAIFS